jgi:hypothetical protein
VLGPLAAAAALRTGLDGARFAGAVCALAPAPDCARKYGKFLAVKGERTIAKRLAGAAAAASDARRLLATLRAAVVDGFPDWELYGVGINAFPKGASQPLHADEGSLKAAEGAAVALRRLRIVVRIGALPGRLLLRDKEEPGPRELHLGIMGCYAFFGPARGGGGGKVWHSAPPARRRARRLASRTRAPRRTAPHRLSCL